ncbi:GumC family protein [Devosia sp. SD17-2]|uniref:GumC family protein n=1 Tax=Devosia sp. SD17-2 TaxID=2976459 RepID=UPI0023D8C7FC|nr:GumC family protein [Devosia sp. SD17-2]WEJ32079.1 GumC family protein [Devosia sp. SD17-2]
MTLDAPSMRDARIDIAAVMGALGRKLPRIILVTLVLLAATFVVLMFMPKLYESSASILVEPRSNAFVRASNEQMPSAGGADTGVVSSQIELIKSRDTLLRVIDELDLRSKAEFNGSQSGFSPMGVLMQLLGRSNRPVSIDETVLNTLYDRMTVVQERDSRIISVLVRSTDPQLAADIANAVARAHVVRRAQLSLSDTADASGWLNEEIARLRISVEQAESAVAQFKVDNDLYVGANSTSLLDQQLSTISTQIATAQERKNTALGRAALIRDLLLSGQPIDGVTDVRASAVVQQLSQEKVRLQGERAQLSATLLPNHPTIRAIDSQLRELETQIRQEGMRVAETLEAEGKVEGNLEATLTADLDRLKQTASTATRDTVALDGLEREAKAQRDLLEAYLLRYTEASSRVDTNSTLPDVRVVTEAAPSVVPASPKTALILAAVGFVALAGQVGVAIFSELLSGRALRPVHGFAPAAPVAVADPVEPVAPVASVVPAAAVETQLPVVETPPQPEAASEDEPSLRTEPQSLLSRDASDVADIASSDTRALLKELTERRERAAPPEEAVPPPPAPPRQSVPGMVRYADLAADLVLGRTHLLLLADYGRDLPSETLARELINDALSKGLSVALVDAGSGRVGPIPGLSDLSAGAVSFGDIVQKSASSSFAEIAWGQGDAIDRNSARPITLVEALGDIYEVVVVLTGRVAGRSSLPLFADLGGRVVLVAANSEETDEANDIRRQLLDAGLPKVEIAALADLAA